MADVEKKCMCTDPQYTIELNKQGIPGQMGEKGEDGFSPVIAVYEHTPNSYKLSIQTKSGTIITPNFFTEGAIVSNPDKDQVINSKLTINGELVPDSVTTNDITVTDTATIEVLKANVIDNTEPIKLFNNQTGKGSIQVQDEGGSYVDWITYEDWYNYTTITGVRLKLDSDLIYQNYTSAAVGYILNDKNTVGGNGIKITSKQGIPSISAMDFLHTIEVDTEVIATKQSLTEAQDALQQEIDKKLDTSIAEDTYGLKTDVSDLQGKVNGCIENLNRAQTDILANTTKIRELDQSITNIKGQIEDIDTEVQTNVTEIADIQTELANLNGDIANEAADREEADRAINTTLEGKQDKLIAGENITIDPETNTISASGGGGDVTTAQFNALEARVKALETLIDGGNADEPENQASMITRQEVIPNNSPYAGDIDIVTIKDKEEE